MDKQGGEQTVVEQLDEPGVDGDADGGENDSSLMLIPKAWWKFLGKFIFVVAAGLVANLVSSRISASIDGDPAGAIATALAGPKALVSSPSLLPPPISSLLPSPVSSLLPPPVSWPRLSQRGVLSFTQLRGGL